MAQVVAVAYSGGRDSTALLHATASAARSLGAHVVALHVHHGLLPQADAWVTHGQATCDDWAAQGLPVSWRVHRVTSRPRRGQSVEAWARGVRYEALAQMAHAAGASAVLLAHHRKDQAETVLLQALRGAGVGGLSAMPQAFTAQGLDWVRPWLHRDRADIEAYLRRHRIACIEDPSNGDLRFDRNRLRHAVWPALTSAFPDAENALATVAHWCQHAARVMNEVARQDLAGCTAAGALDLPAWQALGADRANLALRTWLAAALDAVPPSSLVERLCHELPTPGSGRWPVPGGELRRYRQRLRFHAGESPTAVPEPVREATLRITRAGRYALPGWGGTVVAARVKEGGIPLAWLGHLELKPRTGGEQYQSGFGRPPRSLKKQFQAAAVAQWDRGCGPLVYSGGQLVFVPGLGIDARVIGLPGQRQLTLTWEHASGATVGDGVKNASGKR